MELTRTHDMALVDCIVRHPAIWPHVHDEGTPEDWAPVDHEALYWMLARSDDLVLGVFLVHPLSQYCFEMHTCLLPQAKGPRAARAAQMLLAWAFIETPCRKMVTHVPVHNRAAFRFALAGGMQQEGINRASFAWNGGMVDQLSLGITKEEWVSCQ